MSISNSKMLSTDSTEIKTNMEFFVRVLRFSILQFCSHGVHQEKRFRNLTPFLDKKDRLYGIKCKPHFECKENINFQEVCILFFFLNRVRSCKFM